MKSPESEGIVTRQGSRKRRKAKNKKRKKQESKPATPSQGSKASQLVNSAQAGIRKAASFFKSIRPKYLELMASIKLGEQIAEEIDQVSLCLKEAADRADLLEAADNLEAQAQAIRDIARSRAGLVLRQACIPSSNREDI
jgi:hypothetical protein